MELVLRRIFKGKEYTIGNLYVDGSYLCDTLEDADRGLYQGMGDSWINERKVYGETAIPYGRYKVTLKVKSPKFSKSKNYKDCDGYLPRLIGVPCWDGVLLHIGNGPKDTEGCILVGKNEVKGMVVNSKYWFYKLYDKLKEADNRGEEIWISITD